MIAADFHMMGNLERMVLEDMHRWLAKDGKGMLFEDSVSSLTERMVLYPTAVQKFWNERLDDRS